MATALPGCQVICYISPVLSDPDGLVQMKFDELLACSERNALSEAGRERRLREETQAVEGRRGIGQAVRGSLLPCYLSY